MGTRYVERTREEVEGLFHEMGFKEVDLPGCNEMVFERGVIQVESDPNRQHADTGLVIRAYTSVARNGTRECGADAGRVILVDRETGKGVWKSSRCYRTKSFLDNMRKRCREAWKAASTLPECPVCKGRMVARAKKGQKKPSFYGCAKYPGCRGTRSMK